MIRKVHVYSITFSLIAFLMLVISPAGADSPIEIKLTMSQSTYLPGEPIKMQVDGRNVSSTQVIAQEGFFNQHFYLMITFIDPDGKRITTHYKDVGYEGGPPYRFNDQDAAQVERIQEGAVNSRVVEDARDYYVLAKYGHYRARVSASLETYSQADTDPDTGKLIALLSDQISSETIHSQEVSFDIRPPESAGGTSMVQAEVRLFTIGIGRRPVVEKRPLDGVKDRVSVRLYKRSELEEYKPVCWKKYPLIWNDLGVRPVQIAVPDSTGTAVFSQVPRDDYLLLTYYDGIYAANWIEDWAPRWKGDDPIIRHLIIMQMANGRKTACKTTEKTGSLLLITEPEYIEWDSTQELYPFVFETADAWKITTAVTPPEGFVADTKALSADVANETEAVQFTITDVGSKWKETKVRHKIKHKGKNETIESTIGIRLSKKLAKKKGKGIYGDTEAPGIFKGGKRINN